MTAVQQAGSLGLERAAVPEQGQCRNLKCRLIATDSPGRFGLLLLRFQGIEKNKCLNRQLLMPHSKVQDQLLGGKIIMLTMHVEELLLCPEMENRKRLFVYETQSTDTS